MSRDQRKNIFIIGMDEANLRTLEAVPDARHHRLHPLLSVKELQEDETTVDERRNPSCSPCTRTAVR